MDVRLIIKRGSTRSQTLRLKSEDTVIGRRHGCDIRIPSASVSRRHCRLTYQDGYLLVEDLGSANGTALNGERVNGVELVRPGDELVVGPVTFVVRYDLTDEAEAKFLGGEGLVLEVADDGPDDEPLELELLEDGEVPLAVEDGLEFVEEGGTEHAEAGQAAGPGEGEEPGPAVDLGESWQLPGDGDLRDFLEDLE